MVAETGTAAISQRMMPGVEEAEKKRVVQFSPIPVLTVPGRKAS